MSSLVRRIAVRIMKKRDTEKTRLLVPAVKDAEGDIIKEAVYGYPLIIPNPKETVNAEAA